MAGAAGMLASAVLTVVFKQIGAVIGGQITLQKDFTKDLLNMKMTLESVTAVLEDAERNSIESSSVELWLKRLKDAMYDISDMLDEFEADTHPADGKMFLKKGIMQLACIGPKTKLANRMKKMREKLKEITDQHVTLRLDEGSARNEQKFRETRETTMLINEVIVGRNEEKMEIMDSLSKRINEKLTIFPIYGNGGIGKTTMAKMVFNDTMFNEYFRVWVYVSQMFDLKKIGNSIISQLSKEVSKMEEMQMIHTRLIELFAGKNILIVLDDLWEDNDQFQLNELKKMLKISEVSKIVVIVTTRNESIANDLRTIQPFKLALLSDDSCWTIIRKHSDFDSRSYDDKKQLEHIGKDIARKCGGVALAAKVLGHMLRNFTYGEWESVSKNSIWNVSPSEETDLVFSTLRLTYSYMPSPLRLCFAYCAMFPKGQKIIMDDLIQQWISLDFIDTRELGEKYMKQLLRLSFFEHSATGVHHEDVKHVSVTMHDLVHDLARWVLADELIVGVKKLGNTVESRCRYALLDDCSKKLESYTDSPAKIRALRFLDCGNGGVPSDAFSSAKYIRVLDLSHCPIKELPDSVGQLKLLRYLNLSGCSELKRLPDSIGRLKKLVHLDLSNCTDVTYVSESLHSLTNLEFLDLSYCWKIRKLPEHLGSLLKLKHLNISGCGEIGQLPGSFGNLKNLVHLDLSHCYRVKVTPQGLSGLTNLQHLNLSQCGCTSGTMVAQAMSNLAQLRHLNLSGFMDKMCRLESTMPTSLEYICTLSNLENLDLSCSNRLLHLPECIGRLSKLHTLNLSDCSSLCSVPESIVQMHSLKKAYVKNCNSFISCFVGQGLNKSLTILPKFRVSAAELTGSNLALFQAVNVTNLEIHELETVRSVEEVESIKLARKQSIKHLTLGWTNTVQLRGLEDNKVLESLEPPRTIETLQIICYHSPLFPDWLGFSAYSFFFPNLASVYLARMDTCIRLPPLGQLPNLKTLVLKDLGSIMKIDEDLYGGPVAFSRLESFTLDHMQNLQEWSTVYFCGGDGVSGSMFPSLHKLQIRHCPKLRLKPCPPKADQWTIEYSDGVLSSWGDNNVSSDTGASSSSSSPATTVTILDCNLPLHQWRLLHHLRALHRLCLENCKDLTSSPETIQAFASLQCLSVSSKQCNLAQLPEWLGRLTSLKKLKLDYFELNILKEVAKHLTSLQSLHISHCQRMPQWVMDLISLQRLRISWCEDLCNLQDIMGHTSLKKLDIRYCNGIRSLPESIQQLNLEKLRIFGCSVLELWCELEENKMKLAYIRVKRIGS